MRVKDLIELLQKLDQETLIEATWEGITRPIKAIWKSSDGQWYLLDVDRGHLQEGTGLGAVWVQGCGCD